MLLSFIDNKAAVNEEFARKENNFRQVPVTESHIRKIDTLIMSFQVTPFATQRKSENRIEAQLLKDGYPKGSNYLMT